jgi:hypothetical protein
MSHPDLRARPLWEGQPHLATVDVKVQLAPAAAADMFGDQRNIMY